MYPLDQGRWGPTVRISHLREELGRLVDLDYVGGYRGARRPALMRYAVSGRLRGLGGIYVESSTFLPAETDIAFLGLVRALGIPVLTYIRDAYQLFPEYDSATSLRRRLARAAFRPSMRALAAVSSRLAFPSRGLERAVTGRDGAAVVIPPGSPSPVAIPRHGEPRTLLFVGNGRLEAQGAPRLIEAVRLAREAGVDVELTIMSRPGEEPLTPYPGWLEVINGAQAEIEARLSNVVATVIPRPRGSYNDLAVPVKLYEYLAYGRPLLVTDCTEQALVVREADAGIVVDDAPAAMADGIRRLIEADPEQLLRWGEHASSAASANTWHSRARVVLDALGMGS